MNFEWDEGKNEANVAKHGLDFADVPRIFKMPLRISLDERQDYGEDGWIGLGMLDGRVVVVVYTELDEQTIRIISLRKALPYERKRYEQYLKDELGAVDALTETEIDTSDIPPLTEEFFSKSQWRKPVAQLSVVVQVDPDTLAWFQSQGEDYQKRMAAALRIYAQGHKV